MIQIFNDDHGKDHIHRRACCNIQHAQVNVRECRSRSDNVNTANCTRHRLGIGDAIDGDRGGDGKVRYANEGIRRDCAAA